MNDNDKNIDVLDELNHKMLNSIAPCWARRAADEIIRLRAEVSRLQNYITDLQCPSQAAYKRALQDQGVVKVLQHNHVYSRIGINPGIDEIKLK